MIGATFRALGLSSAALVAATLAVFAQTAPAPQPGSAAIGSNGPGPMAACRADMKALCGNVERRGGGRMNCLVENKAKASAECQAVMATMAASMDNGAARHARKQAQQACQTDAQTLCSTAEKGRGAVMRCLRQNEAKVSPPCAQALANLPMRGRGRMMQPTTGEGAAPSAPQTAPATPAAPKPQ